MSQSFSSIKPINEPLDNKIYKVKHIVNNQIQTIYVFYGKKDTKYSEKLVCFSFDYDITYKRIKYP